MRNSTSHALHLAIAVPIGIAVMAIITVMMLVNINDRSHSDVSGTGVNGTVMPRDDSGLGSVGSGNIDVASSTPWTARGKDHDSNCTIGFVSSDYTGYSAGHCGEPGDNVIIDGYSLGYVSAKSRDDDVLKIQFNGSARLIPTPIGDGMTSIDMGVHKEGRTTGYSEGNVTTPPYDGSLSTHNGGRNYTTMVRASMCNEPGDSGSGVMDENGLFVGILSGGTGDCTRGGETVFVPASDVFVL